ncbi:MAG: lysostaphin resistance A-like protein [Nocardioides sp.]
MTLLRRYPISAYFMLAYAVTWAVWIPGFLARPDPAFDDVLGLAIAGTLGPSIAGLSMAAVLGGRPAVRAMFGRMASFRQAWWLWIAACFAGYPALLVVLGIAAPGDIGPTAGVIAQGLVAVIPVSLANLILGPLGEETGWRGFALPRLLTRLRPLPASVLLGLVWAYWHAPLALLGDSWAVGDPVAWWLLWYPLSTVCFAIVLTYLHLRGRGSLLLAMVAHSALNTLLATVGEIQSEGVATGIPEASAAALTALLLAVPFAIALTRAGGWPAAPEVATSVGLGRNAQHGGA